MANISAIVIVLIILAAIIFAYFQVSGQQSTKSSNQTTTQKDNVSKAPSTLPQTSTAPTASTTIPTNATSVYYIMAPTTMPGMLNDNYSLSMNYTLSIHSDRFPWLSNITSGTLSYSPNPAQKTQTIAVMHTRPGNITILINFRPFSIYTNGHAHNVTPETATSQVSLQNIMANSSNRNYTETLMLKYTNAKNMSYYFNGTGGIVICLRPSVSAIAGAYFVALSAFNLYSLSNSYRCT
ncbi:MAG: hypothetical protein KGH64_01765 [Candidatus Micrarchaeota archaeon]|nr:hypothetical protein [Candidatus Micrarchaeota archaeon]MDE1859134.1 hypothetical protein [Candidatus Micrarchaeota archaeon]